MRGQVKQYASISIWRRVFFRHGAFPLRIGFALCLLSAPLFRCKDDGREKFTARFRDIQSFVEWQRQNGRAATLVKPLPAYSVEIYKARAGALLKIDDREWNCYLFLERSSWAGLPENQKNLFKSFGKTDRGDSLAPIGTYWNVRCFE